LAVKIFEGKVRGLYTDIESFQVCSGRNLEKETGEKADHYQGEAFA
jgi:hypothetical protein